MAPSRGRQHALIVPRSAAAFNLIALTGVLTMLFVAGGPMTVFVVPALLAGIALLRFTQATLALVTISSLLWIIGAQRLGGSALLGPAQIACALALPALVARALRQGQGLTWAPHMAWLAAYVLLMLGSRIWAHSAEMWEVGVQKHVMLLLPYLLLANLASSRADVRLQVLVIYLTVVASAVIGIGEFLLPGVQFSMGEVTLGARIDDISLESGAIKRVTGGIGDGNWFSYTMASGLPLALYFMRRARSLPARVAFGASALLCLAALVLSYTRTGLVGLAAAIALLVWMRRIPVLPLAMAGIVAAVSAPVWMPPGFAERIFSLRYFEEGSTPIREEITATALRLIAERPLTGWGYSQYGPQFMQRTQSETGLMMVERDLSGEEDAHYLRAHNLVLDTAVQFGVPATLALVAFMIGLLRECAQVRRHGNADDGDLALLLAASLVAFYVCGMGGHSQELKIFWLVAGLVAALRRVVLEEAGVADGSQGPPPAIRGAGSAI